MTKVALLIGVSEYVSGLNPLPAALNDIAEMKNILQHSEMGGFDEVKSLVNPDSQEMQIEIARLFANRAKTDLLLLYFSGHGIRDEKGTFYFATRNTQKELVMATAVPARFVHDVMNASRSAHQAIILDSCNSEAFNPEYQTKSAPAIDFQEQLGAKGRVVLASSAFNEYSYERKGDRLSVYTQHLVEGMTTGHADIDRDGYISMQDLHDYASNCFRDSDFEMTPKIIVLKGEGHRLLLSRVKSVDANQYYRDALENILKQGKGKISALDRYSLSALRTECGLSSEAADRCEELAIKPYREREEKLELFKYQVTDAILSGRKTDQETESKLNQIRQSYTKVLTTEDMATAEAEIREKIEALPVTNVPITPAKQEQVLASSASQISAQISASQNPSAAETPKNTNLSGAPQFMKTWMRLTGGAVGLCSLLSIGYFLSIHSQPQISQEPLQQSTSLLKPPASEFNPNNDEAERPKQKNLDQINQNIRFNQKLLDQADAALERYDWNSWQLAIGYANQVLTSEDPSSSQTERAKKIIRDANVKKDDEIQREKQSKALTKPKPSPTTIVEPERSPAVTPSAPQSPLSFPPENSSPSRTISKAECAEIEEKYNKLDIPTREKVNGSGSTIREECSGLGVVIIH
jgi:hypothetical protein